MKIIMLICLLCFTTSKFYGRNLEPWKPGYLDIHTINTGRGNCQFFVFPDGTTMMIDAGDLDGRKFVRTYKPLQCAPAFPDNTLTPAQAIRSYIKGLKGSFDRGIDYFLVTHFHADHYGEVRADSPLSEDGAYKLTGLTELAGYIPVRKLVDRGYPSYDFPVPLVNRKDRSGKLVDSTFANYLSFIKDRKMDVEKFRAGADNQFVLLHDARTYPSFNIRNIKANNEIWTGSGNQTRELYTRETMLGENHTFNENQLACALVLQYGKFRYFAGGDNSGLQDQDHPAWYDQETPMANVVGRVSAMTLNHHGNRDATNLDFLNALDPKVVIMQTWCSDQPGQEVAHRLISPHVGTRKRDLFMTYYNPQTGVGLGPWFERNIKARSGNFVLRVYPDSHYEVFVVDCTARQPLIIATFGPYAADSVSLRK